MHISFNFVKSISTLYEEMTQNGFSLVYLGEFRHDITKMFTSMAEQDMEIKSEEKSVQRKVYHVMVETLQNMNKHSDVITNNKNGNGLFVIGKKEQTYYIITTNKVAAANVEQLENAIKEVNSASKEELSVMYKKQMKEGKISNKGGAGLGLIDIKRKIGEPLNYQFLLLDDGNFLFILKVEINAKKIITK